MKATQRISSLMAVMLVAAMIGGGVTSAGASVDVDESVESMNAAGSANVHVAATSYACSQASAEDKDGCNAVSAWSGAVAGVYGALIFSAATGGAGMAFAVAYVA